MPSIRIKPKAQAQPVLPNQPVSSNIQQNPDPTSGVDFSAFRNFVMSTYPGISSKQLSSLDDFINQRQKEYLVNQNIPIKEIPTDSDLVGALYNKTRTAGGYKPPAEEVTADSAAVAKAKAQTQSGLDSLTKIEEILDTKLNKPGLEGGKGVLAIPWIGQGRELKTNMNNVADLILRKRTGATANKEEINLYMNQFMPSIWDSPEQRQAKVDMFRKEFETEFGSLTGQPTSASPSTSSTQTSVDVGQSLNFAGGTLRRVE